MKTSSASTAGLQCGPEHPPAAQRRLSALSLFALAESNHGRIGLVTSRFST